MRGEKRSENDEIRFDSIPFHFFPFVHVEHERMTMKHCHEYGFILQIFYS